MRLLPRRCPAPVPACLLWLPMLFAVSHRVRACASSFDIREHLSTKAPYAHRIRIPNAPSLYELPDPPGYKPIFLYLLARHGSRWPTEQRLRQINSLQHVFKSADSARHPWMANWTSPMAGIEYLAGELHAEGEAEMAGLAARLRLRFPDLVMAQPYAPKRFPIIATQVPRAAQSASAFALGFLGHSTESCGSSGDGQQPGQMQQQQQQRRRRRRQQRQHSSSRSGQKGGGSRTEPTNQHNHTVDDTNVAVGLGGCWVPHSVALNMLPKCHDPILRFFDSCKGYRKHKVRTLRWLAPWMHRQLDSIKGSLQHRLGLPNNMITTSDVDALWQLCTLEAGLLSNSSSSSSSSNSSSTRKKAGIGSSSSSVCDLFTPQEVLLLEWLEDVRLYEVQGYGAAINYQIAAPLLADVAAALVSAAAGASGGRTPLQLARLNFAHCETLTPLASLLGLFQPPNTEEQQMPPLPSDEDLKAATADLSGTTIDADLDAADSMMDDLVPLVMESDGDAEQPAADRSEQQQQDFETQQQWQQQQQHSLAAKRRKLADTATSEEGIAQSPSFKLVGDVTHSPSSVRGGPAAASTVKNSTVKQLQKLGTLPIDAGSSSSSSADAWSEDSLSHDMGSSFHQSSLLLPPEEWAPGFHPDDTDRVWRGGRVAPLGANLLVVLYSRKLPADQKSAGEVSSSSSSSSSPIGRDQPELEDHLVRLVYNEQVVPIPGCSASRTNGLECSLREFLDVVVGGKADAHQYTRHCGSGDLGGHHFIAADGLFGSYSSSSGSSQGQGVQLLTADGLSIALFSSQGGIS